VRYWCESVVGRGVWVVFFFSSRRRHTRFSRDWSSDVCSSDLFWCFHRRLQVPSQLSRPAGYGNPHWPSMLGRKFESAQRIGIAQHRIDNSTHTPTEHRNARYRTLLASPLRTRRALRWTLRVRRAINGHLLPPELPRASPQA